MTLAPILRFLTYHVSLYHLGIIHWRLKTPHLRPGLQCTRENTWCHGGGSIKGDIYTESVIAQVISWVKWAPLNAQIYVFEVKSDHPTLSV